MNWSAAGQITLVLGYIALTGTLLGQGLARRLNDEAHATLFLCLGLAVGALGVIAFVGLTIP